MKTALWGDVPKEEFEFRHCYYTATPFQCIVCGKSEAENSASIVRLVRIAGHPGGVAHSACIEAEGKLIFDRKIGAVRYRNNGDRK